MAFWLIGRVRLDAREEILLCDLRAAKNYVGCTDLSCSAYVRWGDRCLEYLRGDFCFVVWDEHRQRLFCARDQMGIRPLFYGKSDDGWLISDSLELLAADRSMCSELDEYWIADFLKWGCYDDPHATVYKRIRRVAPAHSLTVSGNGPIIQRYWTLKIGDPLYYSDPRKYAEHFREVVTLAIEDRLPNDRVGISTGGGLDSPTLAALALSAVGDPTKVVAHTFYFRVPRAP